MDVSDADFDSYWENESRNNNRNRIRVGRQYQATVPPLLRPGECDGRRLEDLETLRWRPESLSEQSIDEYMSMAKAVSLFARAMGKWGPEGRGGGPECLQTALRGLSDFVASHHGCQQDAGCRVGQPLPAIMTSTEASLFARAIDECGKNFGAIKKDFLPWKPVKSLIEFYYQGRHPKQEPHEEDGEGGGADEGSAAGCSGSHCPATNCVKKEPEVKPEPPDEPDDEEELPAAEELPSSASAPPSAMDDDGGGGSSEESRVPPSGPEVKPMRAKPLKAPEDAAAATPVGSLKFFLGGRLVLKLSAQEGGAWVEAQDTPRLGRPHRQPPSEDASDDDEGGPGSSSAAGGGATPPLRGSSRCTSWPETAPLTPFGNLAATRMATPEDSASGCNNTNNSTEDEDGGDDDSNQQRPPSASRAAPSPKCPPPQQAPPLGPPPPLNLTLRPPAAQLRSGQGIASNSPPPLLMPQVSPLADGCVERCRPSWRSGRPGGVPFVAPMYPHGSQCCPPATTASPMVTATGTAADGPLDLSSPGDAKKLAHK
ncbi:uncharacterized protein LOC144104865 isoform X1 [Amblyomma americanum]